MDATPEIARSLGNIIVRARIAVSYAFLMLGLSVGLWAVHIPLVQARLQIDPAILGLALLTMASGALVAMPVAGWLVGRVGAKLPTGVVLCAFTALMPFPILASATWFLFVSAFFFGAGLGSLDVLGNIQAAEVETARGKPTMSSFHGFFSIGGLLGAALGAGIIAIGWGDGSGAAVVAAICFVLSVYAAFNLWPSERPVAGAPMFVLPPRAALGLGIIAFLCFAVEGAVTDWSALYLTTVKQSTVTMAATGFAVYSVAMTVLRLVGDVLVARLGGLMVVLGGGVLVILGIAIAIASPWPLGSAAGFAIVGVGAANVVPVVFSIAARTPGMPANVGVAAVATMGYTGFLTMPPILGFIAKTWGLTMSLVVVAAMGLAIALAARPSIRRSD